jgi:hypothetical protein
MRKTDLLHVIALKAIFTNVCQQLNDEENMLDGVWWKDKGIWETRKLGAGCIHSFISYSTDISDDQNVT